MSIAQRVKTSCAVVEGVGVQTAAARRRFAASAIKTGSRTALHVVFKRVRPGVVGIELHAVVQSLAELCLQRVVVRVPHIRHLKNALSGSKWIYLEEVDRIRPGSGKTYRIAPAEARNHGAEKT